MQKISRTNLNNRLPSRNKHSQKERNSKNLFSQRRLLNLGLSDRLTKTIEFLHRDEEIRQFSLICRSDQDLTIYAEKINFCCFSLFGCVYFCSAACCLGLFAIFFAFIFTSRETALLTLAPLLTQYSILSEITGNFRQN